MATATKPQTFNHEESQRQVRHPLQILCKYIRTYVILEGVALTVLCAALFFWLSLAFDFGLFNVFFDAIGIYGIDWVFELNDMDSTGMASLACRIAILVVSIVTLLVLGFSKVVLRWLRDFNDQALALVLERRFPSELGDRLITAVELHDPKMAIKYGYSQDMVEKTIEEAIARLKRLPIGSVFNWRRLYGLWALVGLSTVGMWLLSLVVISGSSLAFSDSWLDPYRFSWRFFHVGSIWTERNVFMRSTYWPRSAHLEIERFQKTKKFDDIMRVEKDEEMRPRPDLQVKAYRYVIADRSAKIGWRPLQWKDLAEHRLVDAGVLANVQVPVDFGDWLLTPEELEPNLAEALYGTDPGERTSGDYRESFKQADIAEKIAKRGAAATLETWLDWREWTVDKIREQYNNETKVRMPLRNLHNGADLAALESIFEQLDEHADSPSMWRTLRKLNVPDDVKVTFYGAKEREKPKPENESIEQERIRLAKEAEERPSLYKDGNRSLASVNKKGSRFVLPLKGLKDSPHFYFRARGEDYYTAVKIVTLVPAPAPTMITVDKDEPAYIYHRLRGVDQSPLAGQRHITRNLALATTGEVNTIDLPQGSDLTIHVELDRRLRSERSVTVENTPNLPKGFAGYPGKDPVLVGDRGFTLAMSKITRDHDFTVEFIDEDNIRGRRRFKLISTIDTEPQIGPLSLGVILRKPRFRQPTGEKDKPARDYSELTNSYLITAVAKLPFECSLKDDYGLVKVGYHYRYRPVDFELISSSSTTKVPVVEIEKSAGRIRDQLVNATIRLWPDHPFPGHVLPQRLMLPSYAGATADAVVSRFKTAAKFQEGYVPCIGFDKVLDRRSGEMILLQQLPSLLTKPSAARGWEFEFKDDLDGFDVGKTLPQFRAFDPEKMAQLHYQLQISVQATDNNVETGAIFDKITGMRGNTKKNPNGTINFLIVTENELLAQIALEEETLQDKVETAKEKVDASMVSLLEQQSKTRDPGTDMELVLGRMNEIKTAISTAGSNLLDVQTAYKNILIEMDINQVRPDRMASIKNNILNRLDQILDDPENASYPMAERDFLKAYDLVEKEASARQAPNAAAHEAKFNLAHQRLQVLSDRLNQLLGAMKQGLVEAQLVAILAGMEQKKRRDTALLNRLWLEEVERQLKSLIDDPKAPKSDEKKTSRMDFVPRPADQMTGIALWPVGAAPMRIESVLTARRREDRHEPLAWPPRN